MLEEGQRERSLREMFIKVTEQQAICLCQDEKIILAADFEWTAAELYENQECNKGTTNENHNIQVMSEVK